MFQEVIIPVYSLIPRDSYVIETRSLILSKVVCWKTEIIGPNYSQGNFILPQWWGSIQPVPLTHIKHREFVKRSALMGYVPGSLTTDRPIKAVLNMEVGQILCNARS